MGKSSGIGMKLYVGGYDLSGDVGSLDDCGCPRDVQQVNGLDVAYVERLLLRGDGILSFSNFFNDAAEAEHELLSTLPTADVVALCAFAQSVGSVAAMLQGKQPDYAWTKNPDGSMSGKVTIQGSGSLLEYGEMLTAGTETHASATSGSSKDDTAQTTNGLAAVLEIVDIDSGTPTVVLEDSANDSTYATLISFTAVASGSDPAAERKEVAGTVDRYLRVTTTGTFTNIDFAMAYRRGLSGDSYAYGS